MNAQLISSSIFLAKLPLVTLLALGMFGGLIIVALSFSNWRAAVKCALVVALLEGAIRKWVFPQGQELIYFLKDGILLGAYLKFYFAPEPSLRAWTLSAPTGFISLLCVIVSFSALNPNIGSFLLALYGLKIYLYYIPLAFMMPHLFKNMEEMIRQLTWFALIATPICLLGVAQFAAPGVSILNVYAAPDVEITGMGFGEKIRITGTFSYLTGHTVFVIFFFALHLGLLMTKQPKVMWIWLMTNLPLLLANAFMGGARASIASMGFVVIGFVVISFFTRIGKHSSIVAIIFVGSVLMAGAATAFFNEAIDTWATRARGASASGDTLYARIIGHPIYAISLAFSESKPEGYGIGSSHPAMEKLRTVLGIARPKVLTPVYDNEIGQVYVELGALGFMSWYLLRFLIIGQSFSAFQNCPPNSLRPILLACLLAQTPFLLMGVVLNHTANIFVWASYGICLIPSLRPTIQRREANGSRLTRTTLSG